MKNMTNDSDLDKISEETIGENPKPDYKIEKLAAVFFILIVAALYVIKTVNEPKFPDSPKIVKTNDLVTYSYQNQYQTPPITTPTSSSIYDSGTGEYKEVFRLHGNGKKKSSIFHLNGHDARLRYKYYSISEYTGAFNIYVVDKGQDVFRDGGVAEVTVNSPEITDESSLQKQPGDYYLQVNAAGDWAIIVEQRQ